MTLSYQAVVKADLKPFSEAVAKWRVLPGQFETIGDSFGNYVVKGLNESVWRGDSATVAFENMATAKKQIHAAAEEAKNIHGLLSEALEAFRSAQSRLRKVAQQVAEEQNLRTRPSGQVVFDPPENSTVSDSAERDYVELAAMYNAYIKSALEDAEAADATLHWALTQDHNGHERGFNADTYHSLRSAADARDQALKDVEIATTLASSSLASLTTEQIRQLNGILAKRQGDPFFSEQFAVRTGASGVLAFWAKLAREPRLDAEQIALLKNLQQSVSHTLATATRSDSAAMRKWEREIIELGPREITTTGLYGDTPYGYQVMSSLVRHGDFDTEFVTEYGKQLIAFDRSMHIFPDTMTFGETYPSWSSLENSPRDPLSGFLEALSNDPDAAKQLFYAPGYSSEGSAQPNAELSYLLQDRPWSMHEDYDDLGNALKAATLGVPSDESGLDRDWRTNNVTAQVMEMVADDEELLQNKHQLAIPLADIGAGYMDALNWAQRNVGGASDAMDGDVLFGGSPSEVPAGGFGDSMYRSSHLLHLPADTAHKYLTTVGQHQGAYETLSMAQYLYTASTMERFGDEPESARGVLNTGAYNQGALDNARFSGIVQKYNAITEEAAEELEKASAWKSFGMKSVVMLGGGILSVNSDGLGGEVVIPIASEAANTAIDNYVIDDDASVEDFSEEKAEARRRFMTSGGERSKDPVAIYAELHDLPQGDRNSWNLDAMDSHHRGWDSLAEAD